MSFVRNPDHFYHYHRYFEIEVIRSDSLFSLFVLERFPVWMRRAFSRGGLPSSCFILINSCSLMYLNCRARKRDFLQDEKTEKFVDHIRFGFGPELPKPASKNFFLSLNDRSEPATDKSD